MHGNETVIKIADRRIKDSSMEFLSGRKKKETQDPFLSNWLLPTLHAYRVIIGV